MELKKTIYLRHYVHSWNILIPVKYYQHTRFHTCYRNKIDPEKQWLFVTSPFYDNEKDNFINIK